MEASFGWSKKVSHALVGVANWTSAADSGSLPALGVRLIGLGVMQENSRG